MSDDLESTTLNFPNQRPISRTRVICDRLLSPLLGIISAILYAPKIISSSSSWVYPASFAIECLAFLFFSFIIENASFKYTLLSLSAYFFGISIVTLLIILVY